MPQRVPGREAVVVGGGIGGIATAVACARRGLAVRVLERASAYGEIGAGIQLAPNATRILGEWGLLDRLRDVGVAPRRLVLSDIRDGGELTHLPLADFPERYGGPYVVLHRSDLLDALLDAARAAGVALETDARVESVQDVGDGVRASTTDGREFAGDVLLAADGLHSVIRPLFSADEPVDSGYVAYRGAVPLEAVAHRSDLADVVVFIGPGRHFVQYPLRAGELYNQVAVFRGPGDLDAAFAGSCDHVLGAIAAVGRDTCWPMYDRRTLDTWVRGRIALLGDAAHPMLQYLAQGACQAIEDAEVVAAALADHPPDAALLSYQASRAPRTAWVQSTARRWGELWHLDGMGAACRDVLLRARRPDDQEWVERLYGFG